MIDRLEVSNYRSLGENVVLELGKLTALVGPNGSGKSNVADVFRFVAEATQSGLTNPVAKRGGMKGVLRWGAGPAGEVSIHVEGAAGGDSLSYSVGFAAGTDGGIRAVREFGHIGDACIANPSPIPDAQLKTKFKSIVIAGDEAYTDERMLILPFLGWRDQLRGLAKALQNSAVYTLSPAVMRELHRTQTAARLDDDGRNWASVLSSLDPISDIPDLVAAIALLNGAIVGIRTERAGDVHVAQFRHGGAEGREDGAWRDASYESDGTLRLAGILIALMQRPRLSLIAIEEPELHLHPGALRVLRDFLREASEHTQILLTTQSPDLLDLLEPDEIRVVDRVDGVTTVSGISDSLKESVRNRLVSLGELQRIDWLRADHEASVAADRG